ncbi:MAG: ATP synthase F1 subunit gamma [Planctomycetota bacterium]|nr:ATP synthase F1 subunit gamma [Planctomycetota bacterium]
MGGIRELRARIKSVGSIKQITRAMEMVSTTKLRRFQDRAVASRPYTEEITSLMGHLTAVLGAEVEKRALFRPGAGEATAVLVVSSDRGLCGAYNTNVFRALETWLDEEPARRERTRFFVYGRKGFQYLSKRGYEIEHYIAEPPLEQIDYRGAVRATRFLTEAFLGGGYRDARVVYTAFESLVRYVPTWIDLLPISGERLTSQGERLTGEARSGGDFILEPDAGTIFDALVPRYLETRIYNALIESITSEYASRRVAMKNATDAAGDMQQALKMTYNRKRQESITMDLLDIVGGTEAQR